MAVRKKTIRMRRRYIIAISLFCCLFTAGIVRAKMANNTPIGKEGEIQVAEWSVDVTSADSGSITLDAGSNSQTYNLTVTNNSEVASSYSIKVSNVPAGVKVGLDITSASDMVTPTGGEATFTNTGGDLGFEAPNNTRTHVLTLAAEATANITQTSVDMTIEVLFEQKDPRP